MQASTITLNTSDGNMNAFLVLPDQTPKRKAVVVIQEAFGVNSHIQSICKRLAAEGYIVIAPELFHRAGSGLTFSYDNFQSIKPIFEKLTNANFEMDISAAIKYLTDNQTIAAEHIAVIGFCMGGFATFLAACRLKIGTAIACYGASIVTARPGMSLTPLINEAKNIKAPLLCLFGGQDQSIPAADVDTIRKELHKQPQYAHEVIVYPEAGHGFICDERQSYNPTAAKAAWARILQWLDNKI